MTGDGVLCFLSSMRVPSRDGPHFNNLGQDGRLNDGHSTILTEFPRVRFCSSREIMHIPASSMSTPLRKRQNRRTSTSFRTRVMLIFTTNSNISPLTSSRLSSSSI